MFAPYNYTLLGLLAILTLLIVQFFVSVRAHRKQDHYIPGKIGDELGHESFVFRSHRTYKNTLENSLPFFALALLAVFIGVNPTLLAWTVWIFFFARLIHGILYWVIATEKNPSPRSYFWLVGFICTVVVLGANYWAFFA
ncbi:MAPEG family protein [Aestuariibacter sp. AA17]|uniref:Microsomal glutathione S-transferase 1 n=1 Tax=Fluctibacter corallii TaxID=2984329 RepID=A0ABT3A415_9ALTE|nr:MAPEG family protein [Aestuariibacter sp. AA17]MCV2883384.1 MAPEG family protein [Aestuariibacter sp. AA17]